MKAVCSLEALGVSDLQVEVYRVLLNHPGTTLVDLSTQLAVSIHAVRSALSALERLGLVTRTLGRGPRFLPTAPDVGLEALILRRQADLEQVRALTDQLMADFHQGRRAQPAELVELVTGTEAVNHRFEQLQRSAKHEVQVLDTPPYAGPGGTPNHVELEALARGVAYRAIYDRAALEAAPGTIDAIARYVAAGEQARFITRLPFKLATIDREFACVPLTIHQPDIASFMVVRSCFLLDALLYVFDMLWERAVPSFLDEARSPRGAERPDLSSEDRRLLTLLATGMKDEVVARQLGSSYRTTRRRIAALMSALGVESRFQAGLYAARNGWL